MRSGKRVGVRVVAVSPKVSGNIEYKLIACGVLLGIILVLEAIHASLIGF